MARRKDAFYNRAKQEGMRSRASYKLIEMQEKFGILNEGDMVLEIGASPGGWTQVIRSITTMPVVAVDTEKMEPVDGVFFIRANIQDPRIEDMILDGLRKTGSESFSAILSDAMVKTSGDRNIDHSSSFLLCRKVMELAETFLPVGGTVVVKQFQGDMTDSFFNQWKKKYRFGKKTATKASRPGSREIYLIFAGKKSGPMDIH